MSLAIAQAGVRRRLLYRAGVTCVLRPTSRASGIGVPTHLIATGQACH